MERFDPSSLLVLERLKNAVINLLKINEYEARQPRNAMLDYARSTTPGELDSPLLKFVIDDMVRLCEDMNLHHSLRSVANLPDNPPKTDRELAIYYDMITGELFTHKFFHIPSARAEYWGKAGIVSQAVRDNYGESAAEMKAASTAYACDLPTACVFHAMRAAEIVMHKVAGELGIEADDEQWKNIIDQIQSRARALEEKPRYEGKKSDQKHFSDIALQLGLMKDAWRNYAAHAKVTYQPPEALDIMNATSRFLAKVAERSPQAS